MGTDIHLYVEKQNADGGWECLPPPPRDLKRWPRKGEYDWWWGPHGCMYEGKCYGTIDSNGDETGCERTKCPACMGTGKSMKWYKNRNYDVFAILADVRNGRGFAGIITGAGFKVIADPRDMPDDVSDYVREHHSWDHTPSWLLLSELLSFDWNQVTTHRGYIPFQNTSGKKDFFDREDMDYVTWKARGGGCPNSWSGDISGPGIQKVTMEEADKLLATRALYPNTYVDVTWTESYSESTQDFQAFMNEFLIPLAEDDRLCTDVRIVFGFDS